MVAELFIQAVDFLLYGRMLWWQSFISTQMAGKKMACANQPLLAGLQSLFVAMRNDFELGWMERECIRLQ